MPVFVGILTMLLTFYALKSFTRASPKLLARLVRSGGAAFALLVGGFLVLRGAVGPGVAIGGLGLWLMGFSGSPLSGFRPSGGARSGVSRVRSAMIEMELDRVTGAIRGVILAGPEEGRTLESLNRAQLFDLYGHCAAHDPEGARLLEAYFDRRFAGWRGAAQGHDDARTAGARPGRRPASVSEDEAYEILGLKKGAPASEIARAHRELMKKLHPDHGGATDLAARVNEAKDVLMRRHHG